MAEQAPDSAGLETNAAVPGGLDVRIAKVEAKLAKLETAISTDDDAATKALGYGDLNQAKAALPRLEERLNLLQNEKVALLNEKVELLKKENLLLQQQQQQSGAGKSMLLGLKASSAPWSRISRYARTTLCAHSVCSL
jgi:hypothetical protein